MTLRPHVKENDSGTIHSSGHLDVCLDSAGRVVAVWFRCLNLPFRVSERVRDDLTVGGNNARIAITAIEYHENGSLRWSDPPPPRVPFSKETT